MGPDFIGSDGEWDALVSDVDIGVVGLDSIAVRIEPAIGTARDSLPFVVGAQPRAGDATRRRQPRRVGTRVVE